MPTMRSPERFNAKRSEKMSQQLNSSTYGSHQMHTRVGKKNRMNASDMHMSSARRGRRASRGFVSNLGSGSVSKGGYSRRVGGGGKAFSQGVRHVAWAKNFALIIFLIVLVLAVGGFVAVRAYYGFVGGRMGLDDNSAQSYLVASSGDNPYYTLFVADLDEKTDGDNNADMVVLARFDQKNKAVTCLAIPSDVKATMSDGESHVLREALSVGGVGELVRTVVTLSDVDISHVVKLTQKDIEGMLGQWGGLEWDLKEECDDPAAGKLYIPAGAQTLNAEQLLTLLRATNFTKGVSQQGINQGTFVVKLVEKLGQGGSAALDAAGTLDKVSHYIHTDWSAESLLSTVQAYSGFTAASSYLACAPTYQAGTAADSPYSLSTKQWQSMVALANAGEDPQKALATAAADVDPDSFTITVKNGSGVAGGASAIANTLTSKGFDVQETGNADSYVYTETLVIYLDDADKDAAQSVCNALNLGRVVDGTNHYVFETDVMVVLGTDWMPQS